MRLSIKTKQVAGVTAIVGLAVVFLSALVPRRRSDTCCSRKAASERTG